MTWVETSSCVSDESTRTQWSASTHKSDREKEIAATDFPVLLQPTNSSTNGSNSNGNGTSRGITRSNSQSSTGSSSGSRSEDTNGFEPIGSETGHDYNGRLPVLTESAVRESDEHSSSTTDEQLSLRLGSHAYHRLDESYPDSTTTALHSGADSRSGKATAAAASVGQHDGVDHDIGNALLLHSNNNKNSSSSSSSSSSVGQHQR
jgi:hypothetical protein